MPQFNGTGTTVTFASGFMAAILDIKGPDIGRKAIDMSHMNSDTDATNGPYKPYIPGKLIEGGGLRVTLGFDPANVPPITDDPEEITIEWNDRPHGTNSTYVFMGFLTDYNCGAVIDDRCTCDVTIKCAGKITITPGTGSCSP